MRFPADNNIKYGQDFRFMAGVPADVDFKVQPFSGDRVKLVASGYGLQPYGNGAIYVSKRSMQFRQYDVPIPQPVNR